MAILAPVVVRLCLVFIAALATAASQTALADPGGSARIKLSNTALAATQVDDMVVLAFASLILLLKTTNGFGGGQECRS